MEWVFQRKSVLKLANKGFFTCLKVALCKNWTPAECVRLLVSTVSCAASSLHGDLGAPGECWSVHR